MSISIYTLVKSLLLHKIGTFMLRSQSGCEMNFESFARISQPALMSLA